jgi:hypothetical protein
MHVRNSELILAVISPVGNLQTIKAVSRILNGLG